MQRGCGFNQKKLTVGASNKRHYSKGTSPSSQLGGSLVETGDWFTDAAHYSFILNSALCDIMCYMT